MSYKTLSLSNLNQIVMQFGQNLGLRNLALDENAATSLIFDDQFLVEMHCLDREGEQVSNLYLVAVLAPIATGQSHKEAAFFYQQLLRINLSGTIMNGLSFAVDSEKDDVLLVHTIPARLLNVELLEDEVEKFVNVLEHWAGHLKNGMLDFKASGREGGDSLSSRGGDNVGNNNSVSGLVSGPGSGAVRI